MRLASEYQGVIRGRGKGDILLPVENFDKANRDIFWLKDESREESDNLPNPDALAQQIVADLEAALEQFREIVVDLGAKSIPGKGQT